MRYTILLLLLLSNLSSKGQAVTRTVLFLGNSYTYENNLPQIVSTLAASAGDVLTYDAHAIGGYTLRNHYTDSMCRNKIRANNWDYIVLQEQSQLPAFIVPSAFMNGFSDLKTFIKQNKPCAQLSSYMTWGYKNGDASQCPSNPAVCTYSGMQSLITSRYTQISELYESEVTPVGTVWQYMRTNYPNVELYQADGSHPSVIGSYLAACCFYTSLFRKSPLLITSNFGLDPNTASIIRNATKTLVFDHLLDFYVGKYIPDSDFNYVIGSGTNEIKISSITPTYRYSVRWSFGDGTTSNTLMPTHSYAANGTYTIKLTSYKCFFGQNLVSSRERTVTFCAHTNTVFPNLLLCPNRSDTLWTQVADSYQWCDETGTPIPGATNRSLIAWAGRMYSVLTTVNGCTEMSAPMLVDTWLNNPDCSLGVVNKPKHVQPMLSPNPVHNVLNLTLEKPFKCITVYDLSGRIIPIDKISPHSYDVSKLHDGMYLLKIVVADGTIVSTKFLKQ